MMRVVDRKTFLALPPWTAYCKGTQWEFNGICFKGETIGNDWYEHNPAWVEAEDSGQAFERLDDMLKNGASFPMDNSECRDGLYDDDAVFLIFERADLEVLRDCIEQAIAPSGSATGRE